MPREGLHDDVGDRDFVRADHPIFRIAGITRRGHDIRQERAHGKPSGGTHARPRPHIRRAHWHGFWIGPKLRPTERRMDVRWMPPLPVGVNRLGDLVPVIRPVK